MYFQSKMSLSWNQIWSIVQKSQKLWNVHIFKTNPFPLYISNSNFLLKVIMASIKRITLSSYVTLIMINVHIREGKYSTINCDVFCNAVSVILIRQTNFMGRVLLKKLRGTQLLKFPAFYETRKFIIVFTRAGHWSLSWARWIQFASSIPIFLRSVFSIAQVVPKN
jgi:hypothetical protein